MGDELDILIAEGEARGAEVALTEPRAASAAYDLASRMVSVTLTNGCGFTFPVALAPELAAADDAALAEIEVLGRGVGLHWEALDADLSVPGLLAGMFGTKAWLDRRRAACAGATRSTAKIAAARANGLKGGRPRRNSARSAE